MAGPFSTAAAYGNVTRGLVDQIAVMRDQHKLETEKAKASLELAQQEFENNIKRATLAINLRKQAQDESTVDLSDFARTMGVNLPSGMASWKWPKKELASAVTMLKDIAKGAREDEDRVREQQAVAGYLQRQMDQGETPPGEQYAPKGQGMLAPENFPVALTPEQNTARMVSEGGFDLTKTAMANLLLHSPGEGVGSEAAQNLKVMMAKVDELAASGQLDRARANELIQTLQAKIAKLEADTRVSNARAQNINVITKYIPDEVAIKRQVANAASTNASAHMMEAVTGRAKFMAQVSGVGTKPLKTANQYDEDLERWGTYFRAKQVQNPKWNVGRPRANVGLQQYITDPNPRGSGRRDWDAMAPDAKRDATMRAFEASLVRGGNVFATLFREVNGGQTLKGWGPNMKALDVLSRTYDIPGLKKETETGIQDLIGKGASRNDAEQMAIWNLQTNHPDPLVRAWASSAFAPRKARPSITLKKKAKEKK